ncbi:uncharacterized [Tachysurus ichikawai]
MRQEERPVTFQSFYSLQTEELQPSQPTSALKLSCHWLVNAMTSEWKWAGLTSLRRSLEMLRLAVEFTSGTLVSVTGLIV